MGEIYTNLRKIFDSLINIIEILFRDWHIRKVINLKNVFIIAFIYLFTICWIILFEFDYSKGFWSKIIRNDFSERRFAFYSVQQRIGEGVLYQRIKNYAGDRSYDYSACIFPEVLTNFPITKHFYKVASSIINYLFEPSFNLALTHHVNIIPYGYNIVYLNVPRDVLYTPAGEFLPLWQHLNDYDAYGDLYSINNNSNELLTNIAQNKPIIPLYLATDKQEYSSVIYDKILITGSLWGCGRRSIRLKLALKELADDGLLDAIGLEDFGYLKTHYLGQIEKYGNVITEITNQLQRYGIALLIHNHEHSTEGLPTSRLAEAITSGAIIITDRNKFIEKYFGNDVLFFDANSSEAEIYETIKRHVLWIKSNSELAQNMTKSALKHFEIFTIENQMEFLWQHKRMRNI